MVRVPFNLNMFLFQWRTAGKERNYYYTGMKIDTNYPKIDRVAVAATLWGQERICLVLSGGNYFYSVKEA